MVSTPATLEVCEFNLLVSSSWRGPAALREIRQFLRELGDEAPIVKRTIVDGIIGVTTTLDPRGVIRDLRAVFERNPRRFRFTCKWVPVDLWTRSDLPSLKPGVMRLSDRIGVADRWRMTVTRRSHARHRSRDLIRALADLVGGTVDLTHPDKILRVDPIGDHTALSVLTPMEIFSVTGAPAVPRRQSERRVRRRSEERAGEPVPEVDRPTPPPSPPAR
jgi:tRNA(Ser,Leu) C12 N-acetylase TAN1